jgi:hypothetical protein
MTAPAEFEEAAFAAIQDEIAVALPSLRDRNLSLGPLEVARGGQGEGYASELRTYVFRDGQICDALEVHMVRNGAPAFTVDELRDWFRSQFEDLT